MQKVPIERAAEGMVLAKPVERENGVVLMGEGTELDSILIEKLKDLDIKKITVKGRPLSTGDEKTLEQLYLELDERFSTVSSDKLCNQVKKIIRKDIKSRKEESDL